MAGGKKRSADEADVATREDGAKRRENTGSTKKRERCTQSRGHPSFGFQSARCPTTCHYDSHPPAARDENSASPALVDDTDLLGALAL